MIMTEQDEQKQKEQEETWQEVTQEQAAQEASSEQAEAPAEEQAAPETASEQTPAEEPPPPTPEELINAINEKYLRLRADFDNYTKRMAREANEIRERTKKIVISEFLPAYDFFQMAMKHAETTNDFQALKQGMDMILNEFSKAFESLGVKELKTVGEHFDPKLHEAAKSEPSDTVAEGIILQQWKAGYTIGDKLLRPAMVVVSSGPEKASEPKEVEQQ